MNEANAIGKKNGLFGFEMARNIYLEEKSFNDFGILTNTFKIKRNEARAYYKKVVDTLYDELHK